ncbi:MAG: hypothetical protein Q8L23_05205 [Caulobacter sp.]|nr:hypothetical protein [Caulobacter sp.]
MTAFRLIPVALAAAAALLALPAAAEPALTGAALRTACREAKGDDYRIFLSPEVARQGAALAVSVVSRGPEAPWGRPIPVACLKRLTVSAPAVATLSAENTRLTIAETAAPGAKASLSAVIDGKTVTVEFIVVAREALVLTGYWREVGDAGCPAGDPPMRELRFLANGRFEATWTPFESYVDFWGTYSFDPAARAISFAPDGGNNVPQGADLDGRAELGADGLLRLSGIDFKSPRPDAASRPAGCPMIFQSR